MVNLLYLVSYLLYLIIVYSLIIMTFVKHNVNWNLLNFHSFYEILFSLFHSIKSKSLIKHTVSPTFANVSCGPLMPSRRTLYSHVGSFKLSRNSIVTNGLQNEIFIRPYQIILNSSTDTEFTKITNTLIKVRLKIRYTL